MGYPMSPGRITNFDNTDALASVAGSATVTVRTITGRGTASVVLDGTGDVDVTIKYLVDGGAAVSIGTSNIAAVIALSFATSLVIQAVNGNAGAKNRCGVSTTGVYQ